MKRRLVFAGAFAIENARVISPSLRQIDILTGPEFQGLFDFDFKPDVGRQR